MKASKNLTLSAAAAAIIAVTGVSTVYAADAVMEQPPAPPAAPMEVAPVATWAGPYAGIALGYGFAGSADVEGTTDIETDGFVGNVFAGHNWQQGSFVYGIEGDVGYNGMKGDSAGFESEAGVDGSLRARLGIAATENVLLYGTAGGAAGRQELTGPTGASDTNTHLGWTAGAGVDVKLTPQSFARLEYRYTDLGSETYTLGGTDYEADASSNKVMLGFGMSF
ncbi:outer membrane protein [Nitratireductor luteus]|uniref:outer membrane protein n=1 Tax=Nitratireductor luteus TaxID=2976980 RepID=UPI002240ADB2|nr:outer membrane protein [Nitratireductor luteus]